MSTPDFTKMFDPSAYTQTMQKWFDYSQALSSSKQSIETCKKMSGIMADTLSTCTEKQLKYAQSAMEDYIEALRDLSTAKGMDDYMQKQAALSQKTAEKCQSYAQEIASQWQKSQTQCTDLISRQFSQGWDWSKGFTGTTSSGSTGTSSK